MARRFLDGWTSSLRNTEMRSCSQDRRPWMIYFCRSQGWCPTGLHGTIAP